MEAKGFETRAVVLSLLAYKQSVIQQGCSDGFIKGIESCIDYIENKMLPATLQANYIMHDDEVLGLTAKCSNCQAEGMFTGNYCPNCGAYIIGRKV